MKPTTPHDPFDDLIAAALHGDLTSAERAQFDSRIANDPAAQAAYLEAQAMNDLLEKTHKSAQPDPAFEQRMVSGVRRKIQTEQHRETSWESFVALWTGLRAFIGRKRKPLPYLGSAIAVFAIISVLAGVALGPITNGIKQSKHSAELQQRMMASADLAAAKASDDQSPSLPRSVFSTITSQLADAKTALANTPTSANSYAHATQRIAALEKTETQYRTQLQADPANQDLAQKLERVEGLKNRYVEKRKTLLTAGNMPMDVAEPVPATPPAASTPPAPLASDRVGRLEKVISMNAVGVAEKAASDAGALLSPAPKADAAPDSRKLIRNAQLDLEVKSFQAAMDQITAFTKAAGGYVDTSNSQKGGNGKLQGTVVVKVLPQNLDGFLLKLRDLGNLTNQSVSTDDVTKAYFDTQARLVNSQKMEAQLQDLLKRENGKVSDLLAVERELGRVRGEIEQMQGQLKLYDFQVQYATVTITMREKDLNQTAAYLLKEQDDFSLFATDVEGTFKNARQAADSVKAQVLTANLNHNSGSDVSAELVVMVAPDQIESFLGQVRGLGRVANFTRQTQRVAKDGGDSDQPADQTLTEKDKVQVHLAIRSDDETRKQVALTVVAKAVDEALEQAKAAALASAGVEVLSSALNKTPQGQSTAQLSVRVPGKDYATVIAAFKALGRTASLSIQRNDNSGPGANGDDAPVIVSLSLTDTDAPLQQTALAIRATDVDASAQQIKKSAATAGVEVKASSFERQPDGSELAQMTFRLPMGKYAAFLETVKALGKVESFTVHRDDRPDQTVNDDTAPVEISLQLHNQRDLVADDTGLFATLRQTFGEGAGALFGSIRVIGVLLAFALPWVVTLVLLAWIGRRIYVWRKGK